MGLFSFPGNARGFEPQGLGRPVACQGVRSEATNPLSAAEGNAGIPSSPPECYEPLPWGSFHFRGTRVDSNRKVLNMAPYLRIHGFTMF